MKKIWIIILLLMLLLTGCQSPDLPDDDTNANNIVPEVESGNDQAKNTAIPPTEPSPPTATPIPEIIHLDYPGEFVLSPLQRIFDCTTGHLAAAAGPLTLSNSCDQWEINYFERPVNQDNGDYLPQLDIVQSEFGQDENWHYARIYLFTDGYDDIVLDGIYAIEIDLDLDAKGDILISVESPSSFSPDTWVVDGVRVWLDKNNDVGGPTAMQADTSFEGDGYEELIFDQGVGQDPDLAWAKTYSTLPGLVEISFKSSLLGDVDSFEWWTWAMKEDLGADKYDPVDYYQVNSIYYLDNTCGWIFGDRYQNLPNLCTVISSPVISSPSESCQPETPPIDPCAKWDPDTCSWDYSCIN